MLFRYARGRGWRGSHGDWRVMRHGWWREWRDRRGMWRESRVCRGPGRGNRGYRRSRQNHGRHGSREWRQNNGDKRGGQEGPTFIFYYN